MPAAANVTDHPRKDAAPVDPLAKLREPFPPNLISKLPKESKRQADERKAGTNAINCQICGGWHHKAAAHLDYVGHAALTDRLLDADPHWSWEPVAFGPDGLPAMDRNGGMWIRLTVCGVTRLGYGNADGKSGGDAVKEIIGDALRNAAMRFGAALDLWHKGDLHGAGEDEARESAEVELTPEEARKTAAVLAAGTAINLCKTEPDLLKWGRENASAIDQLTPPEIRAVREHYNVRMARLREAAADGNVDEPSPEEVFP